MSKRSSKTPNSRRIAIQALKKFAGTRLLSRRWAEFGEEEPETWSVTKAVEVARRIEAALETYRQ